MTSERAYSPAIDESRALNELKRCAGTQFDPAAIMAFERVLVHGLDSVDPGAQAA